MGEVRLDRVRKVYDNGHVAVSDASFQAADGELLVLVGPSGCGKSTLLRMIAGLETISDGTHPDRRAHRQRCRTQGSRHRDGVPELCALSAHDRGGEPVLRTEASQASPAEIAQRVAPSPKIGPAELLDRRPGTLSGGQRQRVALGRAIVRNPQSIPSGRAFVQPRCEAAPVYAHGDRKLQRALRATMIYVTHDQIEAMTLGQRIVVLDAGVIQQIDTPMAPIPGAGEPLRRGLLRQPGDELLPRCPDASERSAAGAG